MITFFNAHAVVGSSETVPKCGVESYLHDSLFAQVYNYNDFSVCKFSKLLPNRDKQKKNLQFSTFSLHLMSVWWVCFVKLKIFTRDNTNAPANESAVQDSCSCFKLSTTFRSLDECGVSSS